MFAVGLRVRLGDRSCDHLRTADWQGLLAESLLAEDLLAEGLLAEGLARRARVSARRRH